jgi:hypothetical protein
MKPEKSGKSAIFPQKAQTLGGFSPNSARFGDLG